MRRSSIVTLTAAALIAAAGCSSSGKPATAVSTTPSAPAHTADQAMVTECTDIQQAYTTWQAGDRNAASYHRRLAAEKTFADALREYNDRPSDTLNLAVTGLGVDLVGAALSETSGVTPEARVIDAIAADLRDITTDYSSFVKVNCPS